MNRIRERMTKQGADFHLITTLDDIAWTLNIRGADVEANPVAVGFFGSGKENVLPFMNPDKVADEIKTNLNNDGVILKPYQDVENFLKQLEQLILLMTTDQYAIVRSDSRATPHQRR
ncbi:MAG: aminopeptidase P family N-terminal domain-containing protein [Saprospiraceae bacterium]|nr:aminopeptidase P family N-terminal domain-containing protein [Saprospiraceae bacterium]